MPKQSLPVPHTKLSQLPATAICGNDILSSALYVAGIAALFAGVFAPVVLLLIGVVLFLYKFVYTEVVEALPINGGAYNCLLNGSSKTSAAIAGVMTILSYVATAVISAKVGIEYLGTLHELPIIPLTIVLLGAFALLVISGLKDSAKVALGIFLFHIGTLITFVLFGAYHYFTGESHLAANIAETTTLIASQGGIAQTLFLAFSACLLGVSGFESSANFVEEQKKGVFRKTLRNMLIGVVIFNPLISLITLNSLPLEAIGAAKDFLLADAAQVVGGNWLQFVVVIDAFLVLSGAVLTAFVGVSGLVYRMAADACLPHFLTVQNKKGSYPRIIIAFFLLCSSILIMTKGELLSLAGVYTISFLGVMTMFAIGNLILKENRPDLKRTYWAPRIFVIGAFLATFVGIIGNVMIDPNNLAFFAMYFIPALLLTLGIMHQDSLLQTIERWVRHIPQIHRKIKAQFSDLIGGKFIVFISNASRLHNIMEYIHINETGQQIILVHCADGSTRAQKASDIESLLPQLKAAGVYPHFSVKYMEVNEPFGPSTVKKVASKLKIRENRVFMGSIHHHHDFDYADFGGVRIIW